MSRNGSGTMSIINSFSSNTTIESAKVNANFSDIASEITGSLPRNGEAGMTGQFKADAGTSGAPGITFSSDPDLGFYRASSNTMGIAGTLTTDGTNKVDAFPSGTKLLFQQTAAPTGWTKDTTHNDKALRVVSGTASSGGTTAFSSVFAARTIAEANLPTHTHSFSATTSSNGDHQHYTMFNGTNGGNDTPAGYGAMYRTRTDASDANNYSIRGNSAATSNIGGTDSAGAHTHTVSGTTGTGSGSGTAMDFAVQYVDVIVATKD